MKNEECKCTYEGSHYEVRKMSLDGKHTATSKIDRGFQYLPDYTYFGWDEARDEFFSTSANGEGDNEDQDKMHPGSSMGQLGIEDIEQNPFQMLTMYTKKPVNDMGENHFFWMIFRKGSLKVMVPPTKGSDRTRMEMCKAQDTFCKFAMTIAECIDDIPYPHDAEGNSTKLECMSLDDRNVQKHFPVQRFGINNLAQRPVYGKYSKIDADQRITNYRTKFNEYYGASRLAQVATLGYKGGQKWFLGCPGLVERNCAAMEPDTSDDEMKGAERRIKKEHKLQKENYERLNKYVDCQAEEMDALLKGVSEEYKKRFEDSSKELEKTLTKVQTTFKNLEDMYKSYFEGSKFNPKSEDALQKYYSLAQDFEDQDDVLRKNLKSLKGAHYKSYKEWLKKEPERAMESANEYLKESIDRFNQYIIDFNQKCDMSVQLSEKEQYKFITDPKNKSGIKKIVKDGEERLEAGRKIHQVHLLTDRITNHQHKFFQKAHTSIKDRLVQYGYAEEFATKLLSDFGTKHSKFYQNYDMMRQKLCEMLKKAYSSKIASVKELEKMRKEFQNLSEQMDKNDDDMRAQLSRRKYPKKMNNESPSYYETPQTMRKQEEGTTQPMKGRVDADMTNPDLRRVVDTDMTEPRPKLDDGDRTDEQLTPRKLTFKTRYDARAKRDARMAIIRGQDNSGYGSKNMPRVRRRSRAMRTRRSPRRASMDANMTSRRSPRLARKSSSKSSSMMSQPVTSLRGIGPQRCKLLNRAGIHTIGQLCEAVKVPGSKYHKSIRNAVSRIQC